MILGVTPVRAGSKGLPGKNAKLLAGKPLLAWSIKTAQAAKKLDRYVVSTEDAQLAEIAKREGAEVLDRPDELAADHSSTFDVLRHALEKIPAELIVLLQATSPIRKTTIVDECIERFLSSGADSLATGWMCYYRPYAAALPINRQERKGFFYDDGNIYIFKAKNIKDGKPYGEKHEFVYTDREQSIDINDEFDFWLAEQVLQKRGMSLK